MMSVDKQHGVQVSEVLDKIPGWDRYKLQKHDLFVTKNEKVRPSASVYVSRCSVCIVSA